MSPSMSLFHRFGRGLAALSFMLLCSTTVFAQPAPAAPPAQDPPGRVGRLSDMTGQVWLYSPDSGEWDTAVRNRPLTSGDRLSTEAGARAEVRIGSATLRLDGGTELEVLRIDDERVSLRLHQGSVGARFASRDTVNEFELLTGEGRFLVQRSGRYRFDRHDPTSELSVYSGQARYEGPGSALTVYSGQRGEFWLNGANVAQYSLVEPVRDSFSAWNGERDRAEERSASTLYVSPEMTGVEDLDHYGRWEQDRDNGPLWVPREVAPGWAPYSAGHWALVQPWGWTWVDDAPWGFAPFHYGRWVYVRNNWCWSPGRRVLRPVYAPALVGWIGGPHFSLSLNFGGGPAVGWFPLAPREVYVPAYRVSPRYWRNVNVAHVDDPMQWRRYQDRPQDAGHPEFRNRRLPQAVTVVPTGVMTGHQPVGPAVTQWREGGGMHELFNGPGRGNSLVAPPVEAPIPRIAKVDPVVPTVRPPRAVTPETRVPPGPVERGRRDLPGVRGAAMDPMPLRPPPRSAPIPMVAPAPVPRPTAVPATTSPPARGVVTSTRGRPEPIEERLPPQKKAARPEPMPASQGRPEEAAQPAEPRMPPKAVQAREPRPVREVREVREPPRGERLADERRNNGRAELLPRDRRQER